MKINQKIGEGCFIAIPRQILRIMKLTTLIIMIALVQVSALTKAQITLNETSASLRKVLKTISKQSGYDFVYNDRDLDNTRPIRIKLENASVEQALQICFENQPLVYEVADRTVMVKRKEDKSVIDRVKDYLAAIDIGGKVVDEHGNPLPGASAKVKNGKQVTVTDQYGEFFLKGVADDAIIVISYLGYSPKEINANLLLKPSLIALKPSESKLDEVQVMAYGVTSRRISTGNIATLKAEDITKQPVDNPLLALQGRVAGLTITPASGLPGAPISVQVRGVNTFGKLLEGSATAIVSKTAEPLFVIDGIPYANNIPGIAGAGPVNGQMSALSFINPGDIESIDVLKDADATAIYGSRGANGVILITTKKGKVGSNNINLNFSSGTGEVTKKLNVLNTQQYLEMRKEAYKNDMIPLPTDPDPSNYDLTVWDPNRYTDWQEEMLGGTARYTNAQASVSGGTSTVRYFISGNYLRQGYVFPGDAKNENGNGHFSITGNSLNNKFSATLTGSYMANKVVTSTDFTAQALRLAPNAPAIYKADGMLNWEPDPNTGFGTWQNPYKVLPNATIAKSKVINSNADLSYRLLSSLTLKTNIGFSEVRGNSFTPLTLASNDPEYVRFGYVTGNSQFSSNSFRSWSVEPQALYNLTIGKGHLNAIAGASLQYQDVEWQELFAYGYTSDALLRNLSSAAGFSGMNSNSQYKYTGLFGRLTYNYSDKYILNLNARRDGSSRFGPKNQFGNFASVGAAWIFSKEVFLQENLPFLSFGKLRLSYGSSGNDGIGDYRYLELYGNVGDNLTYQGVQGLVSSGVTNPYYHWEETHKAEIALELGFLKDRILLSTAYFRDRSSDLLGNFPLPATAGTNSNFLVNQAAKIQSSGLEFQLNAQIVKRKIFSWSMSANTSIQRNKLLALPPAGGAAYGLKTAKVGDPYSGIARAAIARGVDPVTGRYQFTNDKGDATFDAGFVTSVKTDPKFYGGLANTFSYGGLSFDVFLQFSKQLGRNYLFDTSFSSPGSFTSSKGNMPAEILNRWQNPGDIAYIQRFSTQELAQGSGPVLESWVRAAQSTAAYVDASFIRVKNISLSYNIPEQWKQKLRMKNLRVYVQGQNLWTITNYKGLDPETKSISLPQLRILTAGIQVGL